MMLRGSRRGELDPALLRVALAIFLCANAVSPPRFLR